MNSPDRLFISLVILTVAVVTVACAIWMEPGVDGRGAMPEQLAQAPAVAGFTLASEARAVAAPSVAPGARSVRTQLKEYWGSRWPAIEADLVARGKDLDRVENEAPPPWSEVAEQAHAEVFHLGSEEREGIKHGMLLGVQPVTAEFLSTKYGLDAREVSGLNVSEGVILVENQDARMNELAERYCDTLDEALDTSYRNGWFSHAPFYSVTEGLRSDRGVYSKGSGLRSWSIGILVTAEDFPTLVQTDKELASLRTERDALLAEWVKANKPR